MTGLGKGAFGVAAVLGVVTGLGGCSGGATGGATGATAEGTTLSKTVLSQSYNDTRTGYQTMLADVVGNSSTGQTGLTHTSDLNMPTSGTANFAGYAVVVAGAASKPYGQFIVFGDATMRADFAAGTLSGSATNFKGGPENPDTGHLTSAPKIYSGTVSLSKGCIGPTACNNSALKPSQAAAVASGTLTGDGHTVTVNEPLTGQVYGNPQVKAQEIDVTRGTHLGQTTLDGTATDGGVGFVGKN